jgi:integrase
LSARRHRHEGSITKIRRRRKDGTVIEFWCGRVSAGRRANGKHRRIAVYASTKAEVVDKMARLRLDAGDITAVDDPRLTVGAFMTKWLSDAVLPSRRARTHQLYSDMNRLYIEPNIGGTRLSKLMPLHVQGLYSQLERDKKSPRLRQLVHSTLRNALGQALRWGLITRNPCDAVEKPRAPRPTMNVLDAKQVAALLKAARGDRLEALYVLALATGLRRGELLGLQWKDIDFNDNALMVNRTLVELSGKLDVAEPKTEKGRRRVDLPESVTAALWRHRKRMLAQGCAASLWVFCDSDGGPFHANNVVRRSFAPLLTKAKLPHIRFHDLRHTAATLLLAAGVHPKVVQERLGHATVGMTLDTYSHVLPTMQRDAADKIHDLFVRARTRSIRSQR